MDILKAFDPYAWVRPKTTTDVLALLDECIAELQHVNELMDDVFARCEGRAMQ